MAYTNLLKTIKESPITLKFICLGNKNPDKKIEKKSNNKYKKKRDMLYYENINYC
tara:strand:+ start:224 stop:388 length:165 start_codon:yes stop_codon:yes gene_type:complete